MIKKNNFVIAVMLSIVMAVTGGARLSYAQDSIINQGDNESSIAEQTEFDDTDREINKSDVFPEGVVQETYETVPVEDKTETVLPEGVIQRLFQTVPVGEGGETNTQTTEQSAETEGTSSFPDPDELEIYAEDVVSMVMPVISEDMYNFTLDPQNLLSRYSVNKERYEESSLYFSNSQGEKWYSGISDPAIAKNKSSVPVLLHVSVQLENEAGWSVSYTGMEEVNEGTDTKLSLALVPVGVNPENEEPVLHKEQRIDINEDGFAEMDLYLSGTPENFDQVGDKYVAKEDANWTELGFAIMGACNTNADWSEMNERSALGEQIKVRVSYRMDVLTDEQNKQMEQGITPDLETGVILFE